MKDGQQVMVYRRDRDGKGKLGSWYWIVSGIVSKIGTRFARVKGRSAEHIVDEEFPLESDCAKIIPVN